MKAEEEMLQRQTEAATTIQSCFRSYRQRSLYLSLVREKIECAAAITLQKYVRGHQERQQYREFVSSITCIQNAVRVINASNLFTSLKVLIHQCK
jgi:myosin heavy subunit